MHDCQADGVISILEGGYSLSSPVKASKGSKSGKHKSSSGGSGNGTGESFGPEVYVPVPGSDPATCFAQEPADGGLVKGVLAHVAALAGVPHWR